MELPTHYELLCVAPDADAQEIRAAYRRVVRLYHPDVAGSVGQAMTLRFNDALSVLENPVSRARYDRELRMPAMAGGRSTPPPRQPQQPQQQQRAQQARHAQSAPQAGGPNPRAGKGARPRPDAARASTSAAPRRTGTVWNPNRYLAWMTVLTGSIAVVVFSTAIVFIYCYSGPLTLDTPRVLPALIVALAWLVGAARRPAKIFIALLVIGAAVWPLALMNVGPFAIVHETLPPAILALPTIVAVAVLIARIAGPRVSALAHTRPHAASRTHSSFRTARS